MALRIDRRPESAPPFFRVSSLSFTRFSPPVDRKTTLLLGIICQALFMFRNRSWLSEDNKFPDDRQRNSSAIQPHEPARTDGIRRAVDGGVLACWPLLS